MVLARPKSFSVLQPASIPGFDQLLKSADFFIILVVLMCSRLAVGQPVTTDAIQPPAAHGSTSVTLQSRVDSLNAQMNAAVVRVQQIVNQPVRQFRLGPNMRYSSYREGWFHPGATKPDFNNVDVRLSQEQPYKAEYVTSPLNPGIFFYGPDLAFNSQTKYFVTDRTVPKKKLTETELLEINALYRIIGRCEAELNRLLNPPAPAATMPDFGTETSQTTNPPSGGIDPKTGKMLVGGLVLILCFLALRRLMR